MSFLESGLLEIFCRYFDKKVNRHKTYDDFLLYLKKEYEGSSHYERRDIVSLGWNLNRNGVLIAKKINVNGRIGVDRKINREVLKSKYKIDISDED